MAKKRKKAHFHEIRYPKTDRHSKILEQHEKAAQEAREAELQARFRHLDDIKFSYEVATGIIGRSLSALSKEYYKDKVATYNLAEAFLLEVAISEFVFLTNTAEVRESQEYKEWFERDCLSDSYMHIRSSGPYRWTWNDLKSDESYVLGDRAQAEAFVSEVQARVAAADCKTIREMRDAEFARFSSSDIDFEYHRAWAIQEHCIYNSLSTPPIEDVDKILEEWDARGRASRWDVLATIERQRDIEIEKAVEREKELAPEEDSLLWHFKAVLSVAEKFRLEEEGVEEKGLDTTTESEP